MFSVGSTKLRGVASFIVLRRALHHIKTHSFTEYKCNTFRTAHSNGIKNLLQKRYIRVSSRYQTDDPRKMGTGRIGAIYIQNPFRWLSVRLDLLMLKTKLDPEFSLQEFIYGAKQAICTVINFIARGKVNDLRGLVNKTVLDKLINDVTNQIKKEEIEIVTLELEDIYVAFPHEVRFHEIAEKRYCDIDMIFICVTFKSVVRTAQVLEMGVRFHREYTEGMIPDWTITKLKMLNRTTKQAS